VPLHAVSLGFPARSSFQSVLRQRSTGRSSGATRTSAAGDSRLPPDQPGSLEGEDHLVDGGWSDTEMSLQVGFGGRPAEYARICIDEGQILTLLGREVWSGGQGQHRF
jgi:hypothetical protein